MLHDQDEAAGGPTPAGKSWHYTNEFARLIFIPYTQETRHMIHQPTTHKKTFPRLLRSTTFSSSTTTLSSLQREMITLLLHFVSWYIKKKKQDNLFVSLRIEFCNACKILESSEFLRHVSNIMLLCMRYASWLPMLKANSKQPPMDF